MIDGGSAESVRYPILWFHLSQALSHISISTTSHQLLLPSCLYLSTTEQINLHRLNHFRLDGAQCYPQYKINIVYFKIKVTEETANGRPNTLILPFVILNSGNKFWFSVLSWIQVSGQTTYIQRWGIHVMRPIHTKIIITLIEHQSKTLCLDFLFLCLKYKGCLLWHFLEFHFCETSMCINLYVLLFSPFNVLHQFDYSDLRTQGEVGSQMVDSKVVLPHKCIKRTFRSWVNLY